MTDSPDDDQFLIEDSSNLTDADWAIINKAREIHKTGDRNALDAYLKKMAVEEPIRYVTIMHALFPTMIQEAIKDSLAEQGIDEADLRELVRKLESPARDQ